MRHALCPVVYTDQPLRSFQSAYALLQLCFPGQLTVMPPCSASLLHHACRAALMSFLSKIEYQCDDHFKCPHCSSLPDDQLVLIIGWHMPGNEEAVVHSLSSTSRPWRICTCYVSRLQVSMRVAPVLSQSGFLPKYKNSLTGSHGH